ncbi:hypothetical protein AVEN_75962-1 [Araneus ventricosus]|uniref:Uncharacterized protein n=1 Tax=Araneus ventricosus TaxID=182803 RepID=A0A4Y2TGE8_ARAVE|nr:hypothetical protein AVEN_75962-1 [Araneus ventricosus]
MESPQKGSFTLLDGTDPDFVWQDYLEDTSSEAAPPTAFTHVSKRWLFESTTPHWQHKGGYSRPTLKSIAFVGKDQVCNRVRRISFGNRDHSYEYKLYSPSEDHQGTQKE